MDFERVECPHMKGQDHVFMVDPDTFGVLLTENTVLVLCPACKAVVGYDLLQSFLRNTLRQSPPEKAEEPPKRKLTTGF